MLVNLVKQQTCRVLVIYRFVKVFPVELFGIKNGRQKWAWSEKRKSLTKVKQAA